MTSSDVVPDRAGLQWVCRVEVRHGLLRLRDGEFVADVGLLRPGIDVLRRELAMWGSDEVKDGLFIAFGVVLVLIGVGAVDE